MIRYKAHLRAAHFFQCGVLIFKLIAMKFGLYLLMRLLYRPHKLEFKSDAVESVFLIKTVMILYLAHPQEAHLFQCSVLIFYLISMKFGLYMLKHLLYRPHQLKFKSDCIESVILIEMTMIL